MPRSGEASEVGMWPFTADALLDVTFVKLSRKDNFLLEPCPIGLQVLSLTDCVW